MLDLVILFSIISVLFLSITMIVKTDVLKVVAMNIFSSMIALSLLCVYLKTNQKGHESILDMSICYILMCFLPSVGFYLYRLLLDRSSFLDRSINKEENQD